MKTFLLAVLFLGSVGSANATIAVQRPDFQRVFMVIFENTTPKEALASSFFRKIAETGAYFTDFRAETHPSYPNYLAMVSGSTWGIHSDHPRTMDITHLGDLLEAKKKTWRVYAQDYPGNCSLDDIQGKYVRRHVPFLSFKNVVANPERCANVVDASRLPRDIEQGHLADFTVFIPNNDNNGHDTKVKFANQWFERAFSPLLKDHRFTDGLLFVVTFDEDDYKTRKNAVYTALWGGGVQPSVVNTRYDHYSILRTIEEVWGLGTLGRNDEKAPPITGIWRPWHATSTLK